MALVAVAAAVVALGSVDKPCALLLATGAAVVGCSAAVIALGAVSPAVLSAALVSGATVT